MIRLLYCYDCYCVLKLATVFFVGPDKEAVAVSFTYRFVGADTWH